jgi:hypothetical protein
MTWAAILGTRTVIPTLNGYRRSTSPTCAVGPEVAATTTPHCDGAAAYLLASRAPRSEESKRARSLPFVPSGRNAGMIRHPNRYVLATRTVVVHWLAWAAPPEDGAKRMRRRLLPTQAGHLPFRFRPLRDPMRRAPRPCGQFVSPFHAKNRPLEATASPPLVRSLHPSLSNRTASRPYWTGPRCPGG